MSKVWANGSVITVAVGLSPYVVIRGMLAIPIAGFIPLFMMGVVIYLFFATAIGAPWRRRCRSSGRCTCWSTYQ
jgi:ABC-2 type transport system permease protein